MVVQRSNSKSNKDTTMGLGKLERAVGLDHGVRAREREREREMNSEPSRPAKTSSTSQQEEGRSEQSR